MNLLRSSFVVSLAAFLPQVTSAIAPDPCTEAGQAQILPVPPSTNEPIGIKLYVAHTYSSLFPHPEYKYYWFKQTVASTDTFIFDVILTNDTTTFPGYVPVGEFDLTHE